MSSFFSRYSIVVAALFFVATSPTLVFGQASVVGTISTNKTTAYTAQVGNNRIIAVAVTGRVATGAVTTVSGITWGGQALTFAVGRTSTVGRVRTEIWYLTEDQIRTAGYCTSSAFTVNWNVGAPTSEIFAAMTIKDVDQTAPIPSTGTKVNSATTATTATSLALPALTLLAPNDIVLYASSIDASGRTHTAATGYTQRSSTTSTAMMATATKAITTTNPESPTASWSGAAAVINIAGVAFRGVTASIVPPTVQTFYSLASGDWDSNTSWSYSADGSSGAVPVGVWPRRTDNVSIRSGHTIAIDNIADNKTCGISPDGLGRPTTVSSAGNPFAGSNLAMFYQTGDIMIKGTLSIISNVPIMVEGYTQVQTGGTLQATSNLVNLGSMDAETGSTLNTLDDLILTGSSYTLINTTAVSSDDLIFSFTQATLCGTGSQTLTNGVGSTVTFANGATSAQICKSFTVNCTGVGCTGFPLNGTGNTALVGNTGPGGVGNSSNNKLWLRASDLSLTNGSKVTSWNDISGNGTNAAAQTPLSAANQPSFVTNAVNGSPALSFAGAQWLTLGNTALNFIPQTDSWSFFCVFNVATGQTGTFLSKANNTSKQYTYFFSANSLSSSIGGNETIGPDPAGSQWIVGIHMNNTTSKSSWQNSELNVSGNSISGATSAGMDVLIGAQRATSNTTTSVPLTGSIAEIAMYNNYLSEAEFDIVQNSLAARYGATLVSAYDNYTMDDPANGDYDYEVIGIKRDFSAQSHRDSKGPGILRIWNANDLNDGESLLVGHNSPSLSVTTSDVDGTIIQQRLTRVWRTSEVAGDVGTLMLSFDMGSFIGQAIGSNIRLLIDRDNDGFADNDVTPVSGTFSDNKVVFSGINLQHGDRFTIGNTNLALPMPIELMKFSADFEKNVVVLNWTTASEKNNDHFDLMRSHDGKEWTTIGTVKGAGNSKTILNYEFIDKKPLSGISYYMLKQVDFDNEYSHSNVVRVTNPDNFEPVIHPNPSKDVFYLDGISREDLLDMRMFDVLGKQIPVSINWKSSESILETGDLPAGVYFIQLYNGIVSKTIRIVKDR